MANLNNPANVSVGKPVATGCVFVGPHYDPQAASPITLPTQLGADGSLTGYTCVGYLSEDGITDGVETSTTELKVYGGVVVDTTLDEFKEKYSFTMVEVLNEAAQKLAWGTDAVGNGYVDHGPGGFNEDSRVIVIANALKGDKVSFKVIPFGKLNSLSDISYTDSDLIGYEVEILAASGGFADDPEATSREYIYTAE